MSRLESALSLLLLTLAAGCVNTRAGGDPNPGEAPPPPPITVDVAVNFSALLAAVPAPGFGMHSSVYDNAMQEPVTPELLHDAGIGLLRYPGGGYSDNYHWSVHRLSVAHTSGSLTVGYLPQSGTDFPSFMRLVEGFDGSAMITVNYGTNLLSAPEREPGAKLDEAPGSGPGEAKEAAAWVAYANGDPEDDTEIGLDSSGSDWKTVGYWATLRASEPVDGDDPENFLRAGHPEPYGIQYWEIGNELFGNGYFGSNYEEDLHVPYGDAPYDFSHRARHPDLSGATYGAGVAAYARAMKAVDPGIKIGAVLGTTPVDRWGSDWNDGVLGACGRDIDFGIVHYYPGNDPRSMLAAPRRDIPLVAEALRAAFVTYGGDNPERIELTMTEVGSPPGLDWSKQPLVERHSLGLFALDAYLTAFENGLSNVDWLELHNGTFLSERMSAKGPAYHGLSLASRLAAPGDMLVQTSSTRPAMVVHASRRADGRVGILLANTDARGVGSAVVTVSVDGGLPSSGERYDYATTGTSPGALTGPEPVVDLTSPFTLELEPYRATLLLLGETH